MKHVILIFSIILLFPTVLYTQCLKGDCEDGLGTKVSPISKYVGEFKDGIYHGEGSLSTITYSEAQNDLYFKSEKIVFEGIFEMGDWKSGKQYNDDGTTIIYDGEYSVFDNMLYRHGKGKAFNESGIIRYEGIFEMGNWKSGKQYNDDGTTIIYDGEYSVFDNTLYRHGNGLLYIDGFEYDLKFHRGSYEHFVNQYAREDIVGESEFSKIQLKTREGGLNQLITLEINGNSYDYIYDTGAETLDINPSIEKMLIENNLITKKDYYPPKYFEDANGDLSLLKRVKISGIKIGDYILNNVVVSINKDDNSPLLFGRSVLDKKFNKNYSRDPKLGILTLYK